MRQIAREIPRCVRCGGWMFVAAVDRRCVELACLACGGRRYVEPGTGRPQLVVLTELIAEAQQVEAELRAEPLTERQERARKAWATKRAQGTDRWAGRRRTTERRTTGRRRA